MVLTTNPNHSLICIGSQWDLDSLALKPELIKSVRSTRLAALAEMISLAPEMPSDASGQAPNEAFFRPLPRVD